MSLAIDGIATGMQTAQIVEQLMSIERQPISLMEQRIKTHQQRLEVWRDVNRRLASLDSALGDFVLRSTFQARQTESTNEHVMTATASTDAAAAQYDISVERVATTERVVGVQVHDVVHGGAFRLKVGEADFATITIAADSTLHDVAAQIREADVGIQAGVVDNRLVLESQHTGEQNGIFVEDPDGILNDLGIALENDGRAVGQTGSRRAQDAMFSINGITVTRGDNVVDDVVAGVTFSLQGEGTATITVQRDTETALKTINSFVNQFNSTLDFIRSGLAKGGVLQGDSALMRVQSALHQALIDPVQGNGDVSQLSSIGISFNRDGELIVNEDTLRTKLNEDPEAVYKLFAGSQDEDGFDGVARRTRTLLKDYTRTDGLIAGRTEMFERQIDSVQANIERLEERLEMREQRLYRRFHAMEQALAEMQSQSAWLQSQLMQMNAWSM